MNGMVDKLRKVKEAIANLKIFEVAFDDYDITVLDVTNVERITPEYVDYWDIIGRLMENDGVEVNVSKYGDANVLVVADNENIAIYEARHAMLEKLT